MNIITKKTSILCTLLLTFSLLRAQYVSLPDAGWGSWLAANGYAAALTGNSISGWNLDTSAPVVLAATSIQINGDTFIHGIGGVEYFKNLEGLQVTNDWYLSSIAALPPRLLHLELSQTGLTAVPPLPGTLQDLMINGTPLTVIPVLPNGLLRLWCGYGAPKTFTVLPADLADFDCSNGGVTSLPALPAHLQIFNCSFNQLTSLPQLPDTMISLIANNNSLTQLTNLPLYLSGDMTFADNPGLTCLPPFSFISNLTFTNTAIACAPGYNVSVSVPAITSLPLCSSSNPNSCLFASLVYPGDANNDRRADHTDLLNIGLGYSAMGPARSGASIVWVGQAASDWTDTFITGLNYKFADCNGDGTIDAADTVAVLANFGLTHSKTESGPTPWRAGTSGLRVVFSSDTLATGDTLITSFYLGDSAIPASDICGVAFTYHYDPIVTDTTMVSFSFVGSWLGGSADAISISRNFLGSGTLKAAITRTDHTARSGSGLIARMYSRITSDNINGKDLAYYTQQGYISDITAVNASGRSITLNAGQDSTQVAYTPTGIHEAAEYSRINLYPNPAADQVQLTAESDIRDITIYDAVGKMLISRTGINRLSENVDVSLLQNGVYFVIANTTSNKKEIKMIISR